MAPGTEHEPSGLARTTTEFSFTSRLIALRNELDGHGSISLLCKRTTLRIPHAQIKRMLDLGKWSCVKAQEALERAPLQHTLLHRPTVQKRSRISREPQANGDYSSEATSFPELPESERHKGQPSPQRRGALGKRASEHSGTHRRA